MPNHQPDTAPTGSIVADGTCFRQIEFAGILKGTQAREAAQKFIDFLLSTDFQEDMPLQMFVFPVNPEAKLPDVFTEYAAIPEHPVDDGHRRHRRQPRAVDSGVDRNGSALNRSRIGVCRGTACCAPTRALTWLLFALPLLFLALFFFYPLAVDFRRQPRAERSSST